MHCVMICLRWVVLSVLGVVCEWCISSEVCIVTVLYVCNSDEPNVCCVCVVTSD